MTNNDFKILKNSKKQFNIKNVKNNKKECISIYYIIQTLFYFIKTILEKVKIETVNR